MSTQTTTYQQPMLNLDHRIFHYVLLSILFGALAINQTWGDTLIKDLGNQRSLRIHIEAFNPKEHRIQSCGDYICLIDNSFVFGTDGNMPKEKMVKIEFCQPSNCISLESQGMYNPRLQAETLTSRISATQQLVSQGEDGVNQTKSFYRIRGLFSDGAGAYIAEWLVGPTQSLRTHIGDYEATYDLLDRLESISHRQ